MDMWRYFWLTHSAHGAMNAASPERLDEMGDVLRLAAGMRVLDIACGHAELLLRWHARFGITGVGVDASPFHSARASERVAERGVGEAVEIVHARGEEWSTVERFDVAACLGASWVWQGHAGTLRAMTGFARPGGVVVVGEPYWMEEPPAEYLAAEGMARDDFHDLGGCLRVAREQDLDLIWMARSSPAEWDRYEMLQAAAVDRFVRENPEDPDVPALRTARRKYDETYVRWGHRCLGWALWAFRTPG